MHKTQVQSLGQQDPLKESMATQLQYSCLGNSMDRGVWWIMVHGVTRSWPWLSDFHFQLSRFIKLIPWNVFSISNLVFDLAVRRLELVITVNDLQICMVYRSDYLKWFRTGSNREWINSKANHSFLLLWFLPSNQDDFQLVSLHNRKHKPQFTDEENKYGSRKWFSKVYRACKMVDLRSEPAVQQFEGPSGKWKCKVPYSNIRKKRFFPSSTACLSRCCGGFHLIFDVILLRAWEDLRGNCSVQFSHSVVSDSLWPLSRITPGLPVHHQLAEFTQTHVHRVGDAIQPSHPLSSPSPPAPTSSQHQGLFQWVNSSHKVAEVLEFQLQHQSFQWTPRTDLL